MNVRCVQKPTIFFYFTMLIFCVWVCINLPPSHGHQIWACNVRYNFDVDLHTASQFDIGPGPTLIVSPVNALRLQFVCFSPFFTNRHIPRCCLHFSKFCTSLFVYIRRRAVTRENFQSGHIHIFCVSQKSYDPWCSCRLAAHESAACAYNCHPAGWCWKTSCCKAERTCRWNQYGPCLGRRTARSPLLSVVLAGVRPSFLSPRASITELLTAVFDWWNQLSGLFSSYTSLPSGIFLLNANVSRKPGRNNVNVNVHLHCSASHLPHILMNIVCLLKASSPANRTGSPQGFHKFKSYKVA